MLTDVDRKFAEASAKAAIESHNRALRKAATIDFSRATKIYTGPVNGCRCGCQKASRYFDPGTAGFTRNLARARRFASEGVDFIDDRTVHGFGNIEFKTGATGDRSLTIYFD